MNSRLRRPVETTDPAALLDGDLTAWLTGRYSSFQQQAGLSGGTSDGDDQP